MNLKQSLKKCRRRFFEFFGSARYSRPSLYDIDKKLEKYLPRRKGFFIEVGGNDGYSQSNTYYYEKIRGWKGILVEAIPELFSRCKKERTRSEVYNCALVSNEHQDQYVEMNNANLMSSVKGYLSKEKEKEHNKKAIEAQSINEIKSIKITARTLESILDENTMPEKIDFFSLDVEGYEIEVLKGLNLSKYAPLYILVEVRDLNKMNDFLQDRYELIDQLSYHDYLYKLKSVKNETTS